MTKLSEVNAILEQAFDIANEYFYNSGLERPIITVASMGRLSAYGWFTPAKVWSDSETKRHEINISAEYLHRDICEVITTLLHEMVHLHCNMNGIKDVSRGNTYHNKKFKREAELHGLTIEHNARCGWSHGYLSSEGEKFIEICKSRIPNLQKFQVYRGDGVLSEENETKKVTKKSSSRKYVCSECGLSVRATKEVKIKCIECDVELELEV